MKRQWTSDELLDQWTLLPADLALIGHKADDGRLGFAVLLKVFQHEGRFPQGKGEIPKAVVAFIAKQLGVPTDAFLRYEWTGRTIERHRARIRQALDFREATIADADDLSAWLCERLLAQDHRMERLEEAVYRQCRTQRIEPPSPERIVRLIRSAVHTFETRFYADTLAQLSAENLRALDALISADETDAPKDVEEDEHAQRDAGRTPRTHDIYDAQDAVESDVAWDTILDEWDRSHADWETEVVGGQSQKIAPSLPEVLSDALMLNAELEELNEGYEGDERNRIVNVATGAEGAHEDGTADSIARHDTRNGRETVRSRAQRPADRLGASGTPEALLLQDIRVDPGPIGVESVLQEIAKLRCLRQIGLPAALFTGLAPRVLEIYRRRAAVETPSALRAHPAPIRYTLLAALCWARQREVTDSLIMLLLALVKRIHTRAERRVEQAYLEEVRRIHGKVGILYHVAEAALAHPDGVVRDVVYPVASEDLLRDLVKEYKASGTAYRERVQVVMRASFKGHYRRILPALLEVLEFRSNNDRHRPVIRALELIRRYVDSGLHLYPADEIVPLDGVVETAWREMVVESEADGVPRVNRLNYELCTLQAMRDALRAKEIWVAGALRFRNPDEDVPSDFAEQRAAYCQTLHQPEQAEDFIARVRADLEERLAALNAFMAHKLPRGKQAGSASARTPQSKETLGGAGLPTTQRETSEETGQGRQKAVVAEAWEPRVSKASSGTARI